MRPASAVAPEVGMEDSTTDLADDLLRGAAEIGAFLGNRSPRQTFHWLEKGFVPARKVGALWIASKTRLRAHMLDTEPMAPSQPTPKPSQPRKRRVP
jgi:hypothetical protein